MSKKTKFITFCLIGLVFIGAIGIFAELIHKYSVSIPTRGGKMSLGIVGVPRFINPILASTDVDRDVTQLVFSGLMRRTSSTNYIPDLAESYAVSEDRTTYTFVLRKGLRFHDGKPLTSNDVATTIRLIQNLSIRSPWSLLWSGVGIETPDSRTIIFTLAKPYSGFLYATTVGIIPEHIFGNIPVNEFQTTPYNVHPVGSGPYKISGVSTRKELITHYDLRRFTRGSYPPPFLSKLSVSLYQNQADMLSALRGGEINSIYNYDTQSRAQNTFRSTEIVHALQPRLFSLFLNPAHSKPLAEDAVRSAILKSINKESLVHEILQNTVHQENDILPDALELSEASSTKTSAYKPEEAKQLLDKNGWKVNTSTGIREKGSGPAKQTLTFTIATVDTDDLVKTAHAIADTLEPIGIHANVAVYQLGDLDRDIIRPRSYDLLLFGQVLKQPTDLYAFWHSSQRKDPGLNISEYADRTSDALLEMMIKKGVDEKSLQSLSTRVEDSRLVIPLYSPLSNILVPHGIRNVVMPPLASPSDRLGLIGLWYRNTDRIFTFFHH